MFDKIIFSTFTCHILHCITIPIYAMKKKERKRYNGIINL